MDQATPAQEPNPAGLARLDGRIVLVKSRRDRRNPPVAVRGTIEVRPGASRDEPEVRLALEFPQMFTSQAHHRTLVLGRDEIARLLASEDGGTFEIEVEQLE